MRAEGEIMNFWFLLMCAADPGYANDEECYACHDRPLCTKIVGYALTHINAPPVPYLILRGQRFEVAHGRVFRNIEMGAMGNLRCPVCENGMLRKRPGQAGYWRCAKCESLFRRRGAGHIELRETILTPVR